MRIVEIALTTVCLLGAGCSGQQEVIDAQSAPSSTGQRTSFQTTSSTKTNTQTNSGSDDADGSADSPSETGGGDPGEDRPGTLSSIVKPNDDSDASADAEAGGGSGSGGGSGAGSGQAVGYALVEPILKKNCTTCHNATGRSPDMSTYAKARVVGQGIVRSSATDLPTMPEGAKLSEADKATLRAWKDGGFAE